MITIFNTTGRSLLSHTNLVIHNFPFFKEELITLSNDQVKHVFKETTATVIVVKDVVVGARAHADNPNADIYVLTKDTHCVTLLVKGVNGIKETTTVTTEDYVMCSSEMITWK